MSHPTQYTLLSRKPLLVRFQWVYRALYEMVYPQSVFMPLKPVVAGAVGGIQGVTGMVYPKRYSEGCNAAQDKVSRLVYPFSVCVTRYQPLLLSSVMDKRPVRAAPRHPASASRPRNKLRVRSPLSSVVPHGVSKADASCRCSVCKVKVLCRYIHKTCRYFVGAM